MAEQQAVRKINWYRSPLKREALTALTKKNDAKGLVQALGHLGLLVISGAAAFYAAANLPVIVLILILFVHGTMFAFLLNGFHELCHKTVFKSRALNIFFLHLISFLSWYNPVLFWTSHQEHHKYTLHPPDDLEVVLPIRLTLTNFFKSALVDPWDFVRRLKLYIRHATGRLEGPWENALFPPTNEKGRRALFQWARLHIAGHLLFTAISLAFGLWLVPVLITLAPFYGGWLLFLCNNTQHIGLMDNTPDYRLCCRTIYLNAFVRFLYWQMNYHTEHHMYAAVPCYNLGKLHELIKEDLPPCPRGIIATWREILAILAKQEIDPSYQYTAPVPSSAGK
jgi:fatty acid desaturase